MWIRGIYGQLLPELSAILLKPSSDELADQRVGARLIQIQRQATVYRHHYAGSLVKQVTYIQFDAPQPWLECEPPAESWNSYEKAPKEDNEQENRPRIFRYVRN